MGKKTIFKINLPKIKKRIPIAPPRIVHKDKSKYDRKQNKKILDKEKQNI